MGFSLQDIVGGSVLSGAEKIIKLFKVPAEQVAANQMELERIAAEERKAVADAVSREIESASANIRAEAGSGDKYTSRARPSFLYVMLAIFICNYILFPLFDRAPLQFPDALFWLFGSCMLGYTGARSWEKIGQNGKK